MKRNHLKHLKKIIHHLWPTALFCAALFLLMDVVYAQSYLGEGWNQFLQSLPGYSELEGQKSGEQLAVGFIKNGAKIVRYVLGGLAVIMGTLYGMALIFARGREQEIEKQKQNFTYVFIGFIVLIISENIASIFNPEQATAEKIIDFDAARDQLRQAVDYLKWLLGSIILLLMIISSVRMIMAGGEEEEISKQKRNITWSIIGMMVILLASNIVNAVYVINSPGELVPASPQNVMEELAGIIRLILVFLGPLAVAFTIYAGFTYLTAMDNETRAEKGKKMIIGGITGIVIIYSAYALVNTVVQGQLGFIPTSIV